ncbi:hypothetical protein AB0K66_26955 [Streptomyces werraensis]|uniref:hypothetical protein n=1 Tax=Streptomyces werraensis TaxID=68284 RepID=UPI003430BC86
MTLAYSALALVLGILAVALLARRTPATDEVTVTLEDLMRPTLYGVNDLAYCPAEERDTLHTFERPGSRTCWTCRTTTPTAVPRG